MAINFGFILRICMSLIFKFMAKLYDSVDASVKHTIVLHEADEFMVKGIAIA